MRTVLRGKTCLLFALAFLVGAGRCSAGFLEDGDTELKAGRNTEAEGAYTQALETTPNHVRALIGRGRARQALKRNDGAAADFDRALELEPKNTVALIFRARFRESALKDFKGAVEDFTRELRLNQKSRVTYFERGRAQMNGGQLPDALADLDQAVELMPDYAPAHAVRGQVLSKMGKDDEALESCRKALALEPNNTLAKKGVETIEARKAKKAGKPGGSGTRAGNADAKPATGEGSGAGGETAKAGPGDAKEDKPAVEVKPDAPAAKKPPRPLARTETPTLPPRPPRRRAYQLVKVEDLTKNDQVNDSWKRSSYGPTLEQRGNQGTVSVTQDTGGGGTLTSRLRWTVPGEIVPGVPARFQLEGAVSSPAFLSGFIAEDSTYYAVRGSTDTSCWLTLVGVRLEPHSKNRSFDRPDQATDDFDFLVPAIVGKAPEEVGQGKGGQDASLRLRAPCELYELLRNGEGASLSPKTPNELPPAEVPKTLGGWCRDSECSGLRDLQFTVYFNSHRYPVARYTYHSTEEAKAGDFEFAIDPAGKKELRADGTDGVLLKARARAQPGFEGTVPTAVTESVVFSAHGNGAAWVDLSKAEMKDGWKVVYVQASNPDPVRRTAPSPDAIGVLAEGSDGERKVSGVFTLSVAEDPVLDAKPDGVEFPFQSGEKVEVKAWIVNAGPDPWTFRAQYADEKRAPATVTLAPARGSAATLTLQEAGLDPKDSGSPSEAGVLRIFAEQKGRNTLERDVKVIVAQEGLFTSTVGRDPDGNLFRVAADGLGKTTDVDFRLFTFDPKTRKLVNNKEGVGKLTLECLEPEASVAAQALKAGQLKHFFAGLRAGNDPAGTYRFSLAKEIPGDGRIVRCDFKATWPDRDGAGFTAIFTLGFVTTSDGPGSADWSAELAKCQEIIRKFVPGSYAPKMQAILDKHKMTLGAQGLHELRERLWRSAVELTLGEGGRGYADEAAWADHITVTLEWAQWAGDLAFGAVIGTAAGPYGAAGASSLKTAVISALTAYQEGTSADEWLWENLCTIPGLLEGKVIDPATFESLGLESKAKAWAVYVGYHFCKNLYSGATVIEALKNTAREAGSNVLSGWLGAQVAKSAAKAPAAAAGRGEPPKQGEVPSRERTAAKPPAPAGESEAAQKLSKGVVKRDGRAYANPDDVLAVMTDPSQVRALKTAHPDVQQAFSNTREAIYRRHDAEVAQYVKDTVPGMKYRMVKVMEFRTPGQEGASLNTDRDYRVCSYAGKDPRTGKEQWVEVDRRHWEDHSYQTFAKITGGPSETPEAAKSWAEKHQQLATDKAHPEASPDFSDQARVWNPQTRRFENAQIVSNIVRVKGGQPGSQLKDPQALGHMYQLKVKDAKYKHEAFVQAQKAVRELDAVRQGYTEQKLDVGNLPPKVRAGMNAVLEANRKLAADPNRRDPKAIADAEKTLRDNGFQGLDDFMNKLGGQFESLKNAR